MYASRERVRLVPFSYPLSVNLCLRWPPSTRQATFTQSRPGVRATGLRHQASTSKTYHSLKATISCLYQVRSGCGRASQKARPGQQPAAGAWRPCMDLIIKELSMQSFQRARNCCQLSRCSAASGHSPGVPFAIKPPTRSLAARYEIKSHKDRSGPAARAGGDGGRRPRLCGRAVSAPVPQRQ